ncbi:MAG TPA: Flp family type IVb pilin [Devosia sp.]|jgi:pilus assembly protein Flp/PilA|nr:Flp family type IVb pilin [Devosia sp.]
MLRIAIARFAHNDSGATAIEYGLITALVAMALLGTLTIFGESLQGLFGDGAGSAATAISDAVAKVQ